MDVITLLIQLRNPQGKIIPATVIIKDGSSALISKEKGLSKQLYESDKKSGLDVAYNSKIGAYIQNHKGKNKEQILEIIKEELKRAGGSILMQ